MSEDIQILIAKYADAATAEAALKTLETAKENQGVEVTDAVVVSRLEDGKLKVHQTEDVTGGRGATFGGIIGGIVGLLAGPAGVVVGAAVGAAVGGAAAQVLDTGIPNKRLQEIGAGLDSKGAALVILTEAGFVPFIESLIGEHAIGMDAETMNAANAEELGHAHDVSLKALNMGDALADGGMASAAKE